jgi:GNAT superfamily N-acetyltransferase
LSLDISRIAAQVAAMTTRLRDGLQQRRQRLDKALAVLGDESIDLDELKAKIARSRGKTTWLVADIADSLSRSYPPPAAPSDFSVLATDGSHIDVDRHQPTRCFLINIGGVKLSYGDNPSAELGSIPCLYSTDEELVLRSPDGSREQPIEGALLGIKRGVEECRRLAEMAAELTPEVPALALVDGSLILWELASKDQPRFVVEELLDNGFLRYMEELRQLGCGRPLALASYISFPRATDVVNTLRVAICPAEVVDTDRCKACETRECDAVAGVRDRDLFIQILADGQRSPLFISQSFILDKYQGDQRVYFFYLRVDEEIARIEVPRWVALDARRQGLVHSLVLDQCRRGQGYPVALSEAHEQAVLTAADRESFRQLIELSLTEEHLPTTTSAKSRSKKTRWV